MEELNLIQLVKVDDCEFDCPLFEGTWEGDDYKKYCTHPDLSKKEIILHPTQAGTTKEWCPLLRADLHIKRKIV